MYAYDTVHVICQANRLCPDALTSFSINLLSHLYSEYLLIVGRECGSYNATGYAHCITSSDKLESQVSEPSSSYFLPFLPVTPSV